MRHPLLLFLASAIAASAASPAARKPFATQDRWSWRSARDPQIAPDGQWIIYVEAWNDRQADAPFANLWIASSDGQTRRRFTEGNWRDSHPRWSPDSTRIAWLSDRDGKRQLRLRAANSSGETEIPTGEWAPDNLVWSPDGQSIAFTALAPLKPKNPPWAPPSILPRLRPGRVGYLQIFVVPVRGGAPRQVSSGDFDWGDPAWMPDGKSLLAARQDGQIWALRTSGAGGARQVIHEPGRNWMPLPSPDGSRIAWLSTASNLQGYAITRLNVMNADGTRTKMLSGQLDRDPTDPQWSSDSRTVYFLADDHGLTHVYAARSDGTARQVTRTPERLRGLSLADNGRAVSVRSSATEAGDVVTFTVDSISQPVTLATPNEHLLAERDIGAVEEIQYESYGHTVQAWIVKPPGLDPEKRYPLVLDILDDFRGHQRAMYGVDFNLRAQILAAQGFVVLCVNPRGTPGYGETFGNLPPSGFPGDDYDDLMRGVEFVSSKSFVDSSRMAVVGGLLAAWTIGHTARFRAAVARHPIADWLTDVATRPDGAARALTFRGALPWEHPEDYWKHSPVYYAGDFKTPTLVLAGDRDVEGDELYFALQTRGVESARVRVPQVGRAFSLPSEWILELDATIAWLSSHLSSPL